MLARIAAQHFEHCRFWDGCSRPQLRQDLRIGFQCPARLGIARIMLGNEITPLRANKPGSVLFLAHDRGPPSGSSRMRAEMPQSRRHSSAISASSRGIWRTRAPLVTLRVNLETQSLGGCLGIGRNGKVDEIGHANLHVSSLVKNVGRNSVAPDNPYIETPA